VEQEVTEFSKYLATLGVGGILAGLLFIFYRRDVKQFTELWKIQTEVLLTVVRENTASNVKLISAIEEMKRNNIKGR
jgi:hypothetical protein